MNDVPLVLFVFPLCAGAAVFIFNRLFSCWHAARTDKAIARAAEVQRLQIAFSISRMANERLREEIRIIREAADRQLWIARQLRNELEERNDSADYWKKDEDK